MNTASAVQVIEAALTGGSLPAAEDAQIVEPYSIAACSSSDRHVLQQPASSTIPLSKAIVSQGEYAVLVWVCKTLQHAALTRRLHHISLLMRWHASCKRQCNSDPVTLGACAGVVSLDTASGPSEAHWLGLSQRLRDNGFAGLTLLTPSQTAAAQSLCHTPAEQQQQGPQIGAVHAALDSVLTQYERRGHLMQELLAATDLARERESRMDAVVAGLRK